jgi:Asp-tRNA(Asn)/Glu-tRNA(Gln) amidotransferase A subunit family amidase
MTPMRRWLLFTAVVVSIVAADARIARSQPRTLDLLTASIADIQAAVEAGALTYERLVQMYLARIGAYDKAGPTLNAVIAINPRALEIARARDAERRKSGPRSPLHGIPLAIKDNIDTTSMPTTGGNPVFAAVAPARDATVVAKLEQAGAIIFLKTNLDELAMSSQGLSTVGGQTLNPYDLARSPGGSSGGTAVAVSAGFAAAGLATETGISIRGPAANTGIVAIAPTRGLVSRAGVIPISFTQDRVGVHARSVADAALVLNCIRGFDAEDLVTAESLARDESSALTGDPTMALKGMRIGVLKDLFRQGPEFAAANTLIRQQVELLATRGATIVDGQETGHDLVAMMPTLRLNNYELRPAFDAYLQRRGASAPVRSLLEFVTRGQYLRGGNMESRFAETMKVAVLDFDDEYRQRLQARSELRSLLIGLLDAHDLDALVYPVKSLGAPPIGQADTGPRDNAISSVSGLPAIVVPVGLGPDGLPLAMEILGFPFNERTLLNIAAVYERLRGPRVLPSTTPRLPGDVVPY